MTRIRKLIVNFFFFFCILQIIRMTNERFSVPEILFHPSDVGIQEMGIPEAIVHSISQTPEGIMPI